MSARPAALVAPAFAVALALAACRGDEPGAGPSRGGAAVAEQAVAGQAAPEQEAPEAAAGVRAAFAAYKSAATAGDGDGAAALVDRATLAYYGRALEQARTAPPDAVRALPPLDKLVVLSIRHRVAPERLAALDGRGLVALGVADGWIGREGTAHLELGAVSVNGDVATAPVRADGQPAPFAITFRREDGGWRVDLTSVHAATAQALDAALAQRGMDADRFIEAALAQATGRPVSPQIWDPPPSP
jgi:hypothetical protein